MEIIGPEVTRGRGAKSVVRTCLAVLIAVGLVPAQVLATDNMGFHWVAQQWSIYNYSPCYVFESDFPAGAARTRISDARMTWNNVNTELWFGLRTPCTYPSMKTIIVKWDDLWAPFNDDWAFVTCNGPATTNCAMNINTSPDVGGFSSWYWGTGSPAGNQVDGWSVATHEFGHAIVLWHTTASSADMMWPYINMGQVKRSLTTHDKNSIKGMYAYPAH